MADYYGVGRPLPLHVPDEAVRPEDEDQVTYADGAKKNIIITLHPHTDTQTHRHTDTRSPHMITSYPHRLL